MLHSKISTNSQMSGLELAQWLRMYSALTEDKHPYGAAHNHLFTRAQRSRCPVLDSTGARTHMHIPLLTTRN